jgi:hypothetical protein
MSGDDLRSVADESVEICPGGHAGIPDGGARRVSRMGTKPEKLEERTT